MALNKKYETSSAQRKREFKLFDDDDDDDDDDDNELNVGKLKNSSTFFHLRMIKTWQLVFHMNPYNIIIINKI